MLNFSKFRQTDLANLRGQGFKCWLWVLLLPILLLLSGCFFFDDEVIDSGYSSQIVGFASDTTAILLKQYWEQIEEECGWFGNTCDRTDYYDLEMLLVDVRFDKVYWRSKAKYEGSLNAIQWNDSTIFIENSREKCLLWTIGSSKPKKINLTWNTKKEDIRKIEYRKHRWRDDSILIFSNFPEIREHLIIDSKVLTVNAWQPIGEYAWTKNCDGIWWEKNERRGDLWWGKEVGGGCLMPSEKPCTIFLLSEKNDTLSYLTYNNGCENFNSFATKHNFIEVSPIKNNYNSATNAMFKYDEKGNIAQEPSFWIKGISFIDSLGNITEY